MEERVMATILRMIASTNCVWPAPGPMPGQDWDEWISNPPVRPEPTTPVAPAPAPAPTAPQPEFGRDGYDVLFPLPMPRPLPADATVGASQLG
jgi:hypothetical protein